MNIVRNTYEARSFLSYFLFPFWSGWLVGRIGLFLFVSVVLRSFVMLMRLVDNVQ